MCRQKVLLKVETGEDFGESTAGVKRGGMKGQYVSMSVLDAVWGHKRKQKVGGRVVRFIISMVAVP